MIETLNKLGIEGNFLNLIKDIYKTFTAIFFFFLCLFIFERETECMKGRGRERETHTQNLKQAPGSELSAQSLTRARTHKWWDRDLSRSLTGNCLRHPGAPKVLICHIVSEFCFVLLKEIEHYISNKCLHKYFSLVNFLVHQRKLSWI